MLIFIAGAALAAETFAAPVMSVAELLDRTCLQAALHQRSVESYARAAGLQAVDYPATLPRRSPDARAWEASIVGGRLVVVDGAVPEPAAAWNCSVLFYGVGAADVDKAARDWAAKTRAYGYDEDASPQLRARGVDRYVHRSGHRVDTILLHGADLQHLGDYQYAVSLFSVDYAWMYR